ncbi:MAG: glutamate-cysteine ligase family protein [Candidatus Peregrinibacteria bacterium]|nr:glutamate-cysteine ligase family protein [Candidatus Peregrinibacteria bacterium]
MNPFQTFCERYLSHFNYDGTTQRLFGIEKEILIADQEGKMANLKETMWPFLMKEGFETHNDRFYKDEVIGFYTTDGEITTDVGKGTLEVILDPLLTIQECEKHMDTILKRLLVIAEKENLSILGLGYQPITPKAVENWSRKQRHEVFIKRFGPSIYSVTLSSADQVHVDVSIDEIMPVTNVMTGLAGFIMVLFSNSPLCEGKANPIQVYREMVWDKLGKERTGVPEKPWSLVEDYLEKMWDIEIVIAKEVGSEGRYFAPKTSFREHVKGFSDDEIFDAFCIHEGTIWFCARPRIFGTVEIRPACSQPWMDRMTLPAFGMGLVENWKEAEIFLNQFEWSELRKLRTRASQEGFKMELHGKPIASFIKELLDIAKRGLTSRGHGEESYLDALYQRAEDQKSPSDVALEYFHKGGVPLLIEKTSLKIEDLT